MIKADVAHECTPTCSPLQERCCDGWPHCLLMTCAAAADARRDQFWQRVAKSGKVYGHPDTLQTNESMMSPPDEDGARKGPTECRH